MALFKKKEVVKVPLPEQVREEVVVEGKPKDVPKDEGIDFNSLPLGVQLYNLALLQQQSNVLLAEIRDLLKKASEE